MSGGLRPAGGSRVIEVKRALIAPAATFEGTLVDYREGPGGRRLIYFFRFTEARVVAGMRLPVGGLTYGFYWEDRPYNVYFWLDAARRPLGLYFNVSDETRITRESVEWRDLVLDVLIPVAPRMASGASPSPPWEDWILGRPAVLDEDEVPPDAPPPVLSRMRETVAHILAHHETIWNEIRTCPALARAATGEPG